MEQTSVFKLGLRMMGRYVVCSVLCIILIVSIHMFPTSILTQLLLVFCSLGVTLSFIYQAAWSQGEHDANYIDRGLLEEDKLRGLKAGMIATALPLLIFVLALLCKISLLPQDWFPYYRFAASPFYMIITWLCGYETVLPATEHTKEMTVMAMFSAGDCAWWRFLPTLLPIALLPLAGHLGYMLGRKRINVWEKLVYQSADKKPKKKKIYR